MINGGYDEGYKASPNFWGTRASSLIERLISQKRIMPGMNVLDAGCGEGKNAFSLALLGCHVDAIDCSTAAFRNGRNLFVHDKINWQKKNILDADLKSSFYDIVIAYGLLHCLESANKIILAVEMFKDATKSRGINVICAFNDGPHDMDAAHPGFNPILLPHQHYLSMYEDWQVDYSSSSILYETHPHNSIPHHHSMTRFVAVKP